MDHRAAKCKADSLPLGTCSPSRFIRKCGSFPASPHSACSPLQPCHLSPKSQMSQHLSTSLGWDPPWTAISMGHVPVCWVPVATHWETRCSQGWPRLPSPPPSWTIVGWALRVLLRLEAGMPSLCPQHPSARGFSSADLDSDLPSQRAHPPR